MGWGLITGLGRIEGCKDGIVSHLGYDAGCREDQIEGFGRIESL